jgi:hypothetical protein
MSFRRIVTSTPSVPSGTAYTGRADGIYSLNEQTQVTCKCHIIIQ